MSFGVRGSRLSGVGLLLVVLLSGTSAFLGVYLSSLWLDSLNDDPKPHTKEQAPATAQEEYEKNYETNRETNKLNKDETPLPDETEKISQTPIASEQQQNLRVVRVRRVYDGDTFFVDLNCDIPLFCQNIAIRVRGINCAEMKGGSFRKREVAMMQRDVAERFIGNGQDIRLERLGRDKYFRIDADVKKKRQDMASHMKNYGCKRIRN